ncbi:MAG: VWA domain-containing protein [Gemmatimonadota bacterium]|nr:VWA domain-containing protein [Gemmatimonadota bacterium]
MIAGLVDLVPGGLARPVVAAVLAAAAAVVLRWIAHARARDDRARLADVELLDRISAPPPAWAPGVRGALLAVAAGCLGAAAAGGGWTDGSARDGAGDMDIALVLDASNSMRVRDVAPDRLGRQRALVGRLVTEVDGRFAVVAFAGGGYVLSPLTEDADATRMFVETADPSLVGRGGTSLAAGLAQGLAALQGGEDGRRRAVVLVSDGEETVDGGALEETLAAAAAAGIPVHVLGVGTLEGGPVPRPGAAPEDAGAGEGAWMRDAEGREVVSRLEEESLRSVAAATGGLYAPGAEAGADALIRRLPASGRPASRGAALLLLGAFLALSAEAYLFRRA